MRNLASQSLSFPIYETKFKYPLQRVVMIISYWKIRYIMCASCLLGVTRLKSHFSFMYCLKQFEIYFHLKVGGGSFAMFLIAPLVLTMNVLGNPLGLDVPQRRSKCSLLGFFPVLPMSHFCYFKQSHWFSSGAVLCLI